MLVVPVYEEDLTGVYYNTAAVIDADGPYLGKFRKMHIPHCAPGFWEKFYFRPGNLGYPVFETRVGKIGVYICYDRHFPEGARCLGLNGAEIVFNPSATVAGLSEYLWKLEQPAHAVANGYFIGAINRPGFEEPWRIGEFYGQSYFCDPRGQMLAVGKRDTDDIVIADLDFDLIREVRNTWQFFRDRRPESYWRYRSTLISRTRMTTTHKRISLPMSSHTPAAYTGPSRDEVLAMRKQYLTPGLITYYREPLLIVEGHMQYVWDETGKQYLDAFAGIVTVSVGHCHPKVVEKVREQVGRLQHTTTIYLHPTIGQLGKKLAEHMPAGSGLSVSYFTNSGSEANEIAILSAREFTGNHRGHQPAQRLPRRHAGGDGPDGAWAPGSSSRTRRSA